MDKDIKKLFDSVNVSFTDGDAFLDTLGRRLEKVEFIREAQDAQIKRYKVSVIYSLIAGLVVGAGSMALLPTLPVAAFEKVCSLIGGISMLETANPIAAVNLGISLITGIASFLIVRNFQEMRSITIK